MSDYVSRETSAEDARLFGDRLELAQQFAELLGTDGMVRGLIGPREVPRIWERHILNCGVVAPAIAPGSSVADVGSGAGLPGLVWAIARPDISVALIEPLARRTSFLEEVAATLSLSNVRVVRARAEEVHETFDVVTSRAVAALPKLAGWCMPLVAPGGHMMAIKGRSAADEVATSRSRIAKLGGDTIVVSSYGEWLDEPTTVVDITRAS